MTFAHLLSALLDLSPTIQYPHHGLCIGGAMVYFVLKVPELSIELGAIGQAHPNAIRLLCDFHRSQAWERWVNKNANDVLPQDRDTVLSYLKDLAYAVSGTYIIIYTHTLYRPIPLHISLSVSQRTIVREENALTSLPRPHYTHFPNGG